MPHWALEELFVNTVDIIYQRNYLNQWLELQMMSHEYLVTWGEGALHRYGVLKNTMARPKNSAYE